MFIQIHVLFKTFKWIQYTRWHHWGTADYEKQQRTIHESPIEDPMYPRLSFSERIVECVSISDIRKFICDINDECERYLSFESNNHKKYQVIVAIEGLKIALSLWYEREQQRQKQPNNRRLEKMVYLFTNPKWLLRPFRNLTLIKLMD